MTESRLRTRIRNALAKEFGGVWWVIHGGPFQEAGISDILGLCRGKFFSLEVKRPGEEETLSPLQAEWLSRVNLNGGFACMVTSIKQAEKFVRTFLQGGWN